MSIPAIVLTCQRYAPLADHMIDCYRKTWPDHPFKFYLPNGTAMQHVASQHPGIVKLIDTAEGDARGRFKAAVLDLLQGLNDHEWVYWCPDDKYPIWLDRNIGTLVHNSLMEMSETVAGLSIANRKTRDSLEATSAAIKTVSLRHYIFTERRDYRRIWLHQFLRVGVIRRLFESFPDVIENAKDMDTLHRQVQLPAGVSRYILNTNAIVFGESTHRGMITANCAKSLQRYRGIPEGFARCHQQIIIGKRPWSSRLPNLWQRQ